MVQAVGIHKMGAGAAQLGGPAVHHLDECLDGAGIVHRQHGGGVIAGLDHQAVEKILHGHLLTHLQGDVGAARLLALQTLGGDGDFLLQILLHLQGQQTGHHLGQARREEPLIDVLGEDQAVGVQVIQQRSLGLGLIVVGIGKGLLGIQGPGAVGHAGIALEACRHGRLRLRGLGGLGRNGCLGRGRRGRFLLRIGPDRGKCAGCGQHQRR